MNLQRLVLSLAAGALGATAYFYLRNRKSAQESDDSSHQGRAGEPASHENNEQNTTVEPADQNDSPADASNNETENQGTTDGAEQAAESSPGDGLPGGERELSEFLGGESWFDEVGWQEIWKREGIANPTAWLRKEGLQVLRIERKKLIAHPALLAGCRRRWIVVSRYADIDVAVAAELWNATDDGNAH